MTPVNKFYTPGVNMYNMQQFVQVMFCPNQNLNGRFYCYKDAYDFEDNCNFMELIRSARIRFAEAHLDRTRFNSSSFLF